MNSYQRLIDSSNLTFDDEFTTFLSSPNGSVGWMTSFPYGGSSARTVPDVDQAEFISDSSVGVNPFSLKNGVLSIAATVAAPGSNPYGLPYNSGMITSYKSLSQIYGYFEMDAKLPPGQGLWPAFYLLQTNVAHQTSEIDVMEALGSNPDVDYTTVRWAVNGVWRSVTAAVKVPNEATGFNTYGVDWEPTTTTVYMDGQVIASFATPAQADQPMYMLAANQVGGAHSWPGLPSSSAEFPATMQINYIRAYASANTIDVSGTQAIETAGITGKLQMAGVGWVGATVSLLNAAGTVIATTSTNAAGTFSFVNLAAGDYRLHYALPPGLAVQSGSPAAAGTGLTAALALTDGQTLSLPAEILLAPQNPATIQSTVDVFGGAGNTTRIGGDSSVTVRLLDGSGNIIASTVSASNGDFSFGNLAAGTYQLEYMPPNGQTIQPGGNANATTGLTATFTVAAGQAFTAPSGDMVSLASIDGAVVLDGVGEAGVKVAVLNTAGSVVASATTGAGGTFAFTDLLAAGTYQLKYTAPSGQVLQTGGAANATTGITPVIALATSQVRTAPTEQLLSHPGTIISAALHYGASTDSPSGTGEGGVMVSLLNAAGAVIATTVSTSWGRVAFGGLAAGTYRLKYTAPAGQGFQAGAPDNPATGLTAPVTVAAGQTVTAPAGRLVTTGAATGIAGAVTLAGAAEAGVTVSLLSTAGKVLATTRTDGAGTFTFAGLAAGSYVVKYTAPSGQVLQAGSEADAATGATPTIILASGQAVTLPTEQLQSRRGTIASVVEHHGASTDDAWGTGIGGVTVALLNAAGAVVATTVSSNTGRFAFGQVDAGTYRLQYTAPAGDGFLPRGPDTATGLTAQFTVAAGQTVNAPAGALISVIAMNGSGLTKVAPPGAYLVTGNAGNSRLTLGNGNQFVTLTGGADTVTTGAGDQTITLAGNRNTVTVGKGNDTITLSGTGNTVIDTGVSGTSTIHAGSGGNTVRVTGGTDHITIDATGAGNLFDAGPGLNFLNADGSAGNRFLLNAATRPDLSLTTITGFNPAGDILDLKRTLAGADILPDLSNLGSLVTAAFSGANTILYAAPAGGGSPVAFAALDGVHVTVAQLLAAHDVSLG